MPRSQRPANGPEAGSSGQPPCYYELLGIERNSDTNAINKAYRKLALKWHPDKNPNNQEEATKMFQMISNAYEILSDKTKRSIYDQYGHDGLRQHEEGGNASSPGHATFSFTTGGPSAGHFDPLFGTMFRDPFEVFRDFFAMSGIHDSGFDLLLGMDGHGMHGANRRRPSNGPTQHNTTQLASYGGSPFGMMSSFMQDPFGGMFGGMGGVMSPFGGGFGGGSSVMMSSFGGNMGGGSMMSSSSTSTKIVNGHQITTKRTVTNGRETVKQYEDGQLTMHTVDGVAQPLSSSNSPNRTIEGSPSAPYHVSSAGRSQRSNRRHQQQFHY